MKYSLLFLCSLFIFSLSAQSDLSPEMLDNINKRIEYELNPSIVIGVVDEKGPRYYNFGGKTLGATDADEYSIYEIGSITKTFTGILLAHQVLQGKMKLDDPAQKYLPQHVELPTYQGKVITLGHLADHTSSLPRMPGNFNPADPNNPYADYTPELLYEFLSEVKLEREIGSEYEYSNLGQGLLGFILERHTGKSYDQLVKDVICQPLGMDNTAVVFSDQMKSNLAQPYSGIEKAHNWDIAVLTGAGAIRSSVVDMLKYLQANMGLTPSYLSDAMKLSHEARHDKAASVGLAWFIEDGKDGAKVIQHGGATGGYLAFAAMDMTNKKGVVIFTNTGSYGAEDLAYKILDEKNELKTPKASFIISYQRAKEKNPALNMKTYYEEIKSDSDTEVSFNEGDINSYGYKLLGEDKFDEALNVFEVNMAEFPKTANTYDSYAEALMKKSIAYYKKSIELNPNNQNAFDMLEKMGATMEVAEVKLSAEDLLPFVGTYELAPSFVVDVTSDGDRLFAQATGQQQFELFPINATKFYLKVVDAQVEFVENDEGVVDTMVLYQNGMEMPGKRQ